MHCSCLLHKIFFFLPFFVLYLCYMNRLLTSTFIKKIEIPIKENSTSYNISVVLSEDKNE